MPHGVMDAYGWRPLDHVSPFAPISTPSDVMIQTPPADNAASPANAPSPLSVALRKKTLTDRAYMFLDGRHDDLLRSLSKDERRLVEPVRKVSFSLTLEVLYQIGYTSSGFSPSPRRSPGGEALDTGPQICWTSIPTRAYPQALQRHPGLTKGVLACPPGNWWGHIDRITTNSLILFVDGVSTPKWWPVTIFKKPQREILTKWMLTKSPECSPGHKTGTNPRFRTG